MESSYYRPRRQCRCFVPMGCLGGMDIGFIFLLLLSTSDMMFLDLPRPMSIVASVPPVWGKDGEAISTGTISETSSTD